MPHKRKRLDDSIRKEDADNEFKTAKEKCKCKWNGRVTIACAFEILKTKGKKSDVRKSNQKQNSKNDVIKKALVLGTYFLLPNSPPCISNSPPTSNPQHRKCNQKCKPTNKGGYLVFSTREFPTQTIVYENKRKIKTNMLHSMKMQPIHSLNTRKEKERKKRHRDSVPRWYSMVCCLLPWPLPLTVAFASQPTRLNQPLTPPTGKRDNRQWKMHAEATTSKDGTELN